MPKKITIKDFISLENPNFKIIESIEDQTILDVSEIVPLITPGGQLRTGLDEIICAENGALIVLGVNEALEDIMKGGIRINVPYTHSILFELSKMDGAIILSNDLKNIVYANVHLMPDKNIPSEETGIRHRSAQQVAIDTSRPVISISKRRKLISLFYKNKKYVIQDLNLLLVRANHLLDHLEKYRSQVDEELKKLDVIELNKNNPTMKEALIILQKILYFFRHVEELNKLIVELGTHGVEISQSLYEYSFGLDDVIFYLIKDYSLIKDDTQIEEIMLLLKKLDLKTIINDAKLCEIVFFPLYDDDLLKKKANGYRLLSEFPLTEYNLNKLINSYTSISNMVTKTPEDLSKKGDINISLAKTILIKLKEISNKK